MKPPKWNQINASDYSEAGPWFTRFVIYLNYILQPLIQILNNNVTISDNMKFLEYAKSITTDASYPSVSISFSFSVTFEPKVVMVSKNAISGSAAPTSVPITWTYSKSDGSITINSISGLSASTKYDMTILVL